MRRYARRCMVMRRGRHITTRDVGRGEEGTADRGGWRADALRHTPAACSSSSGGTRLSTPPASRAAHLRRIPWPPPSPQSPLAWHPACGTRQAHGQGRHALGGPAGWAAGAPQLPSAPPPPPNTRSTSLLPHISPLLCSCSLPAPFLPPSLPPHSPPLLHRIHDALLGLIQQLHQPHHLRSQGVREGRRQGRCGRGAARQ